MGSPGNRFIDKLLEEFNKDMKDMPESTEWSFGSSHSAGGSPYRVSAAPEIPPAPRVWRPFFLGMVCLSFGLTWLIVEPIYPTSNTDKVLRFVFAAMIFFGARFMRDYGHASASLVAWREKYEQRPVLPEPSIELPNEHGQPEVIPLRDPPVLVRVLKSVQGHIVGVHRKELNNVVVHSFEVEMRQQALERLVKEAEGKFRVLEAAHDQAREIVDQLGKTAARLDVVQEQLDDLSRRDDERGVRR